MMCLVRYKTKGVIPKCYIEETRQRWTLGAKPVAANFDKYISKLKEMGMDEYIKNYQTAYDRYKSSK